LRGKRVEVVFDHGTGVSDGEMHPVTWTVRVDDEMVHRG